MTPDQTKRAIRMELDLLLDRATKKEITASAVERIIEARAKEAARHHGIPDCWVNFLPWPTDSEEPGRE